MTFRTADLHDQHAARVAVAEPGLWRYGGAPRFHGPIATVQCLEDNSRVKEAVQEEGLGRVLVVDGGGSLRCALLGDQLAASAVERGWSGVVVYGAIRDSVEIAGLALGCLALGTHPARSVKRGEGLRDVPVRFLGVGFEPGQHLYADEDGLLVSREPLL